MKPKNILQGWRRVFAPAAQPAPPPPAAPAPDAAAVKAALQAGLRHHQSGEFAAAERLYRQALAADPRQADALHLLGVIAHQSGDNTAAADLIGQAIAISPGFASYHTNLGNVLLALSRHDAAVAAYQSATDLAPDFAEAHYNLGNAYLALEDFAPALTAYDTALRLKPDYGPALSNRGSALLGLGRTADAIAAFEAAIRLHPDDLLAHHKLGNAHMAAQNYPPAIAAYNAALRLNPAYGEALTGRGIAQLALGHPAEARTSFAAALQQTPEAPAAHYNFGLALHGCGSFDAAIAAFDTALRLAPDHPDAASRRQFALYGRAEGQGDYAAAFAALTAANRLRRAAMPYDERLALTLMARIETVFTPAILRSAEPPGGPPDIPIFILGMPRSGSTLVEQILSSHRDVAGCGELPFLGDILAGPGSIAGQPYPENFLRRPPADLATAAAAYRARLQAIAPHAARITDKQPANFHHIGLIHRALPRAKIIHTRRDAVDTCFSCFTQTFTDSQPFTNDLAELARYYRAYARLMAHWRASLPPGVMYEIDYETLVADFEPQVRRLLDYCELPWDPACLAFHEHDRPVLTASAAQVRQKLFYSATNRTAPYGALLDPLRAALAAPP